MSVDKVDADIEEKLIQAEAYGAKHYVDDKLLLARHVVAALEHKLHRKNVIYDYRHDEANKS